MTTKTKITLLSTILAIAVIGSVFGYNEIIALDADFQFDKSARPNADAIAKIDEYETKNGDAKFREYSEKILSVSELYDLGAEWKVINVATVNTVDPFEITKFVVYARLVDSPNNARQCEYGTEATIVYDAKTGDILEKNIPQIGICEEPLSLGKRIPQADLPDFIPQADASSNRAFLSSEQGSDAGHYGGFGYMKVPTLDETANPDSIYNEQDAQVYYGYNQVITGKEFQVGWLVTTVQKALVFADEYTYGNLTPHGIAGLTWTNDGTATVYIECGSLDDYYIRMYHGGTLWSWDTNYDCDNTTDDDINNSVFLENANTVVTSEWSDEIETTVKAWSLNEYDTKTTWSYWNSASNTYENCPSGTGATGAISSSLGSGGTSIWTVSSIDDC